jgi:PKD repeat protein
MPITRCLRAVVAAALGCGLVLAASAGAQTCPLPETCSNIAGSPVKLSLSGHYFETYTTPPIFLTGQTYEYLCHVSQPLNQPSTCTLENYCKLFSDMQGNLNNVIRVEAIFDHSPGSMNNCNTGTQTPCPDLPTDQSFCNANPRACCCPYAHEQPFTYKCASSSPGCKKWSLVTLVPDPKNPGQKVLGADLDNQYLTNLESVVCDAYKKGIVVEVSLFNVWDGKWETSPFNQNNTVPGPHGTQGFTQQAYFMTTPTDSNQANLDARTAQLGAVDAVVQQLMKYPNIIWEVANEPDLVHPTVGPDGHTLLPAPAPSQVFSWQQLIIAEIRKYDTSHLVEIEGHYLNPSNPNDYTFAWKDPYAKVEGAHYTNIEGTGLYGAITLLQNFYYPQLINQPMPVSFNENTQLPNANPMRNDDAVRAEAWDFAFSGGALFNGYSLQYGHSFAKNLKQQLFTLSNFLLPLTKSAVAIAFLDDMRQVKSCDGSDWCNIVQPNGATLVSGTRDEGKCANSGANLYFSSLKSVQDPYGFVVDDYPIYFHHGQIVNNQTPGYGTKFNYYVAMPSCFDPAQPSVGGYQTTGIRYSVADDGCYIEHWLDPVTGSDIAHVTRSLCAKCGGSDPSKCGSPGSVKCWYSAQLAPPYSQDVLFYLQRPGNTPSCGQDPPLTASFTFSCNYLYCNFDGSGSTGSVRSYTWNWGDGTSPTASGIAQQVHNFGWPGSYNVTLTVGDNLGNGNSTTQTVQAVAQPPSPAFSASCNLTTCTFVDGSHPGSAAIHSYSWTFGDLGAGVGPYPSHTYASGGNFTVTETVTDDFGISASTSQTIAVTGPPAAKLAYGCTWLACSFDASGSTPGSSPIASYAWTFGDGASGSGVTASHTYAAGGTFTVTLTVTDTQGQAGTQSQQVTVAAQQPPVASFTFSCLMLGCTFDGSGSAPGSLPIASYAWQYGDGGTASGTAATSSHSYAATGAYTVTLTVTDTSGRTATASQLVQVSAAPLTANESYFSLPPCRLLDTRNTGGPLGDGQSRVVTAAGACGIPATAKAISVVVTAVSPTNPGKIALIAGNQTFVPSLPPFTLNFAPQTSPRSNDEIVPLAANGTLAVGATFGGTGGQVQVLLDVDGYFSEDTAPAAGAVGPLGYQPVTNCRLADTRPSSSPIVAGTVRSFTAQGVCGIPAGAAVASIRTGVSAPATGGGFTVYPSNLASPPPTTTINFVSGIGILRNETRVPLASATPDFSVVYTTTGAAGSSADAFFDTNGYFQAGAPLKYHPIASCRAYSGTLAGGVTQLVQVQGSCGVPAGAAAVFARLGVWGPTATGDITLRAAGTAPPPVSTIKFDAGEAGLSLGTIVPLAAGAPGANDLAIFNNVPSSATASLLLDIHGYLTSEATAGTPPAASFAFTCTGLTCSFDASASSAGSSPIVSYSWSYGDAASAFGVTSSHSYPSPASYTVGRYPVTLTVIDSASRQTSVVRMVSVNGDPALPAESYFAVPPCRLLDTRNAPNTVLTSGQTRIVQIAGPTSPCGIPSSAKAVSITVTAVAPTGAGILDLYPGDKTPTVTSIDFDPARSPRATNTIELLALNEAGTLGVLPSVAGSPGQVHLVLDVDGYFSEDTAPASGAQGPLGYQTVAPCRLVDTRTTNTPVVSGTVSNFTIQGNCGIPAGAVTAALNVVSVAPSNLGFFILYPSSLSAPPIVSNLNWLAGISAIANGARPTLAATTPDLKVVFSSVAPGNTAHLVLDTMGYFKSGAPYKYHPVAECRAAYTAGPGEGTPSIAAGTTRSFQIQGNCGVPVGAKAAFIKTSLNPLTTNAAGLLSLYPAGGSPNGTSFLNWDAGETWMSGGAIVTLSSNIPDLSVASNLNADLIIKVFGYFQ